MMTRVMLVALIFTGANLGGVSKAEQLQAEVMSEGSRTHAIAAFMKGDFEPYRKYLEASLAWHLKQMEARPFDRKKIGEEILRYSSRNQVKLTQYEYEQKVEEAQKLVQGFGGGWQSVHREQVRQLYESLALLCSIMSDSACELRNRKLASQYE